MMVTGLKVSVTLESVMTHRAVLLVGMFLALATLAQQAPHSKIESRQSAISQVREAWMRNFNAKNTDGVLALYTEHATVVSEAGTFQGREAIRPWVQASIDLGSWLESIEPMEEKSSGTLAYGTGRSRRWLGSELHLGQYLIVMERIGNDWKIVQHFSMNVKPGDAR
jgi:ketosteroid isomerase-like protein